MNKNKVQNNAEDIQKEFQKLVKKISTEDLKDMLSLLSWNPEIEAKTMFSGQSGILDLNDKERDLHSKNVMKMQYYDEKRFSELNRRLKDDFDVYSEKDAPSILSETDVFAELIPSTKKLPKVPILIDVIKSTLSLRETGKEYPDEQKVKLIECFTSDHSENDYDIVINSDYDHPLSVSKSSRAWGLFFDLLQEKSLAINTESRYLYDYINFNSLNRIKTNTPYQTNGMIKMTHNGYVPTFKYAIQTKKALVQKQKSPKKSLKNT